MKVSTEALINKAIETNTEIQEDNLHMLRACIDLCDRARVVNYMKNLSVISKHDAFDETTLEVLDTAINFCDRIEQKKDEMLSLSIADRKEFISKAIDKYVDKEIRSIGGSLINMLDASITDLDKSANIPAVKKLTTGRALVYNKMAVENLTSIMHNVMQELSFLSSTHKSFEGLCAHLKNTIGCDISTMSTHITHEGFVDIDIPQPSFQTMKNAMYNSVEDFNNASKQLRTITYKEMMERLGQIKLGVTKRLQNAKDVEDVVKSVHLTAQMIMSVKNSLMLMQNYHKSAVNEMM